MANTELYTEEQINRAMADLQTWKQDGNKINREISAANFAAAVGIVNAIAILAETAEHHPDILIYGWNKIRVSLTSHDKGGLTEKDFNLAKKIEELNF